MMNLEKTRSDSRQRNRMLFFGASAFHPHRDWCLVSLGGVEFAVFSEPVDADFEAGLNGEYLWRRHCSLLREAFRFPFLFRP